ncbi:class I SAM-dependent DNA methyltransferase [Parvicella tangerina]|uniref:2-methoxy-6-polyprenyl-1,4-benzoquinol methylase, mitochondrial n=1 Tax=Parvicella tangerina TaxID=2829795 RepID=A0A916JHW0_9FLAO|nr:class I SAM-dependent methyltransferase [Parvicella tangerina]CAG5076336.1 2-methoxy-6-polyprenyl-1,4-benzoquinol methylase, mitochondrial [Parvicella tangerina]
MDRADFDHIANQYDADFSNTLIGQAQRKLVWNILDKYYPTFEGIDVLEINCGTGVDAVRLAEKNANILATDIAPEMVNVTRSKLKEFSNAKVQQLNINHIETVNQKFDLIFSNFGGLNCLDSSELSSFISKATALIKDDGMLILVIMPQNTIWETLYFSSKLSPKKAFRRMKKEGVTANVEGKQVQTYYYNPSYFNQFKDWNVRSATPIGLYVPPSYLERRYTDKPKKIERYFKKDLAKFNKKSLAKFADHYCIVLEKK